MIEETATVPEHRCCFELQYDDLGGIGPGIMWWEPISPFCCWRPIWEGHEETDRYIWHADVDEKTIAFLADRPSRRELPDSRITGSNPA